MEKKITLKNIATEFNLSIGTVSRILNGKAKQFRISEQTVELVLKYANAKGYSPNLIAKGLQASKTFTIGLMIPDIANPFFAIMAKHIEKAASLANYSILLVDAEEIIEKEMKQVKNMIGRKVDGIIAAPVGISFEHFKEITQQRIPLVFVDRYCENIDIPYFSSNNYQGALDATEILIKNGHKKIALIKGDEIIEPVKERRRGFESALSNSGIKINENYILGNGFTSENGYKSTLQLMENNEKPTAIIAMSNLIGLGILQAAKEEGIRIPEDLSLIIFDDQPYVSYLNPPITTVKQNSKKIGEMAIEFILKKIDNPNHQIESQLLATKVVERSSVNNIK